MQRPITGFGIDAAGDPYAVLTCHHRQHVRHRPPFSNRPWVTSEAGRRGKLGECLDCVRCDRLEFPEGLRCYRRTPTFDHDSVPAGLLRDHTTRPGVWGRIVVLLGSLDYHVRGMPAPLSLVPDRPGNVPPEHPHHVAVAGPVRFLVEFWRPPGDGGT